MKIVNIYTDGACSGNQNDTNSGGWGCVLEYGQHTKELSGGELNTTNNRMELLALINALSCLKEKGLALNVFSDSAYVINCFKGKWYLNWQKNGWKTSSKTPVENKALWEQLLSLLDGHDVNFYLVKGHLNLNWPEEKLAKAYDQFVSHNGTSFTYDEFIKIVAMNIRCDDLATTGAASVKDTEEMQ